MFGLGNTIWDAAPAVKAGGGGASIGTLKKVIPIDPNNFQINYRANNGQFIAQTIVRNQGTADAGSNSITWRKGPMYVVDSIDALISVGGWKDWAASNGAQDYARNRGAPVNKFGGSVHGGETLLSSESLTLDGQAITGLAAIQGYGKVNVQRTTRITWADDGSTADVVYTMDLFDMSTEMTMQHSGPFTMGSLDYATCGFVGSRFTRLSYGATVVDMTTPMAEYDVTTSVRAFRLTDPIAGDYVDITFTIDVPVSRIFVWWHPNNEYSKFYVRTAGGILPLINVTQNMKYYMASVSKLTMPFTDTFSGSALSALWRQTSGTAPGAGSVVTGDEWVLTNGATAWRFSHPLSVEPGTYHIELDYKTDAANTGSVFYIAKQDKNITAPYIAGQSLNSLAGTTLAVDLVVTEGMVPYITILSGVSGRVTRFRELRITKTA